MKFRQNGANAARRRRKIDAFRAVRARVPPAPLRCASLPFRSAGTPVAYNAYKEKEKRKGLRRTKRLPFLCVFPSRRCAARSRSRTSPAHAEKRAEKKAAAFSLPREKILRLSPVPLRADRLFSSRSPPRPPPHRKGRFFLRGRRSPLCKTGAKKQPAREGRLFCFVYFSSRCLSPLAAMSRRYCMPRQEMHDTPA